MAVYTVVSAAELAGLIGRYNLGTLRGFVGVSDGIENTNYFVSTSDGEFVLTLFEATPAADLPFFLDLMAFLADHGVRSPRPIADRSGTYLQRLHDRPAALVERLQGASVDAPNLLQCQAVGMAIASIHALAQKHGLARANDRGVPWRLATAASIRSFLAPEDQCLLDDELELQRASPFERLPCGVIHADLFRDNALFTTDVLNGIIDFYYAYTGAFIYDVAVTVSDWCYDGAGNFDLERARAIVAGYRQRRPVGAAEIDAWVAALRAAGLRFWLSRLRDQHYPKAGAITRIKDPGEFKRVILDCRQRPDLLMGAWNLG